MVSNSFYKRDIPVSAEHAVLLDDRVPSIGMIGQPMAHYVMQLEVVNAFIDSRVKRNFLLAIPSVQSYVVKQYQKEKSWLTYNRIYRY